MSKARLGTVCTMVAAAAFAIVMDATPKHEGRKYVPYRDFGNGVWTVCDGITGGIDPKRVYTDDECDVLLEQRLRRAEAAVDRNVKVEMTATRRAALIDWTFNLGEGNLASSTMLKKLNRGDIVGACQAIMDWTFVAGKDCKLKASRCSGIVRRREWERDMCLLPEPEPRPWWQFWGV